MNIKTLDWGEGTSSSLNGQSPPILPKSESPGSPDSADNFEFSAERLSENAKSIKITLFVKLLTVISPIFVQSLQ